jgi:iron complex outermembrane recepter protein
MHRTFESRGYPTATARCAAALHARAFMALAVLAPGAAAETLGEVTVQAEVTAPHDRLSPDSLALLDREDILRSGARNLPDLLGRIPGATPSGFFSNGKFSGVDLRGQGQTSVSNVLVLVDGIRLNVDQAGPDLSTISLPDIDRVEVRRGAQSVRFGDGAVGGVIEIFTRRARRTRAEAGFRAGSHGQQRVSLDGAVAGRAGDLRVGASRTLDDGYRSNSAFDASDLSARANWQPLDALTVRAGVQRHEDTYGLPGFVTADQYRSSSGRRAASDPFGGGSTQELRFDTGLEWRPANGVRLDLRFAERNRSNPFSLNPVGPLPRDDERNRIDLRSREAGLHLGLSPRFAAFEPRLDLGLDWREGVIDSRRNGNSVPSQSTRRDVAQDALGAYALAGLELGERWSLEAGVRRERTRVRDELARFDRSCTTERVTVPVEILPGIFVPVEVPRIAACTPFALMPLMSRSVSWDNEAWQAGLAWALHRSLELHGRVATSFRSPNPDDLALAGPDLRPQRGEEAELGLRIGGSARLRLTVAAFASRSHDEIYFDSQFNRNFDESIDRRGLETTFSFVPRDGVDLRLNLTHTRARFSNSGGRVPLVPELAGQAALGWSLPGRHRLDFNSLFAGSRLDGGELGSARFPLVPAWHVESIAWSWQSDRLRLQAGVNNLLNAAWTTAVFGGTFYPLMGREAFAQVALALP